MAKSEQGDRSARVRRIFHAAAELPPEARAEYLAEACGGDAGLRAEVEALLAASEEVMAIQQKHVTIPRRIMYPIRDMAVMQDRFHARGSRQAERLAQHPRFRAAYDLMLLRAASGEEEEELATWWTEYQETAPVPAADAAPPRRRRRPRKRPRRRPRTQG